MRLIDQIYINGEFVTSHEVELFDLHNPATGEGEPLPIPPGMFRIAIRDEWVAFSEETHTR